MIDWADLRARNEPLNAFLNWDEGASGGGGVLSGLTAGVKANIAVAGLPWTGGMALHRDRVAERDAEVVARLRAAGGVVLGMLNMEEAALGAVTDNPWFGRTQNPRSLGHTPGGSSGGSGAAVAAGLCDIALGTDTLGSVRIPAAYCGVFGFKPAAGAVSLDGLELLDALFDSIGPLARDLDTLERAARVMGEFGDGAIDRSPAMLIGLGEVECQPTVLDSYQAAVGLLNATAQVELPHPLSEVRMAGFVHAARALGEATRDPDPALLSDRLHTLIAVGRRRSAADLAHDERVLADTAAALTAIVETHGALLLPTAPQVAFRHGERAPASQADFTCLANIAGLPALAVPSGRDECGLPVGVQLIGRAGHETGLFALARRMAPLNPYGEPT